MTTVLPHSHETLLVVGQGYVGLPLAMAAVAAGYDVTGFDLDERRTAALTDGHSYVEDVGNDEVAAALHTGRYHPVSDPAALEPFDIAVISVPTPLSEGAPDLSFIEAASRTLSGLVRPGCTVVLESTTYPGTTEELVGPILAAGSGLVPGRDFALGYSPERVDPGNKTFGFETTPKVVAGVNADSLAAVDRFFSRIVQTTVPVSTVKVAELTKLLENTFRHVNIALVNELAMFANDLNIDIWEAIDAASTKPFGYMRFTPGPGVGGHCLPVDPSYLSWQVRQRLGQSFRFVELANDVNAHMPDYVIARLTRSLNERSRPIKGQRILLLGMAYKRNTGDARESPSREIAEGLLELGAHVHVADPHMDIHQLPSGVVPAKADSDELAAADVVVALVDHDAFDAGLIVEHASFIFDCKDWLRGPNVERL